MEDDKIEQRQVLLYKNANKTLETELQYRIKLEPVVLEIQKGKCITVNICNAAEKIEEYPEAIQKLVWRTLRYKCEIETRRSITLNTTEHYEKLTKYIEAFRQSQKLIIKMCKKRNLGGIFIEGGI